MTFLLDENFPLRLYHLLRSRGIDCDHVILLKLRGASDRAILERVEGAEDLVLLTQDGDFEHMPPQQGQVLISRVPQNLPIQRRVDLWMGAIDTLLADPPNATILEISAAGALREIRR